MVEKGLSFIEANAEQLLKDVKQNCPRWFAIVLPTMLELSKTSGLEIVFPETVKEIVSHLFSFRKSILENCDGSLFQSPSATAKAFMMTGKQECLAYLQSVVQRYPNGVPQTFPMDEDLIKLCIVNHLQRLGLNEHFPKEIEDTMAQVQRNYMKQESWVKPSNMLASQLHKDSLAFELLRMHGYKVSSSSFCWFLHDEEIRTLVEKDYEFFSSTMLNIYRASNLMFYGEHEVEEARSFSRTLLEKAIQTSNGRPHVMSTIFHKMIKYELSVPWFARLDHLEHRMWIEESETNALWKGKTSYNRISHLHNDHLLELAKENYEFKLSIYRKELEELKSWSERWGLSSMGFGREKTTYCYFAIAAATSLPHDSYVRTFVAKSAIIITVADDFFDMEGSLSELEGLTDAIRKWDSRGLSGHRKVIFQALDNLVSEASTKYLQQVGIDDITNSMRDLKEKEEGKINSVLINMVEDPESNIEESIALVREMIHKKEKELLEHALIDGHSDLPKASNQLHLSCLKVFHMFFNSSNRFDSNTEMLQDISKAIYLPVSKNSKPFEVVPLQPAAKKKNPTPISYSNSCFKHYKRTSFTAHQVSLCALRKGHAMVHLTNKVVLGFL
ncbi:S-linalool synthase [Spatholobus suberectus]|nr:S-linalool synthase [Spatholobus suberectus]